MGRKKSVEYSDAPEMGNFETGEVNLDEIQQEMPKMEYAPKPLYEESPMERGQRTASNSGLESCLRNERIIVRRLPKRTGLVSDSNHILGDGMHDNAYRMLSVPKLQRSNNFVNVLTTKEKDYLETVMGLEPNALSIYKQPKEKNFWSNANPAGLSFVKLTKKDNVFDLSKPTDYISYKILLANKDKICPSMQEYQERPKETYEYVIIKEGDERSNAQSGTDATIQAFMKLGKISDDAAVLRLVAETMLGKKFSDKTAPDWYQTQLSDLIKSGPKNAKLFLSIIDDEILDIKVLIRKGISKGIIADRGGYLYIKDSNTPMCGDGEEPTYNTAAKWLSMPRNQEVLFSLQAKIKN
jgi:hypothetical protein